MGRVVVVGSSNTDLVTTGRRLPKPGQTLVHEAFFRAAGGKGANQAVAARRAGADVCLVAAVGDDAFGREALHGFARDGIRTRLVKVRKRTPSGVALILVDRTGENMITVAPGANATLSPSDVRGAEPEIMRAGIVLASLEVPLPAVMEALRLARRHGRTTVLNPAPAPAGSLPASLLAAADILTPNEHEVGSLGPPRRGQTRIVTRGARGVTVIRDGRRRSFPAFKVRAVDAVGAGDAFSGALAAALAGGRALEEAIGFAQAAAALAVTRAGAQPAMPTLREIRALLASQG